MLGVFGDPLDDDEVRRLTATLIVEGTEPELTAAGQLTKGLERGLFAVGLDPGERNACLCALEEAPTDRLGELRGVLLRDHERRTLG